jgi:hypothetical protein
MSLENKNNLSEEDIQSQSETLAQRMAKVRESLAPLTGKTTEEQLDVAAKVAQEKADRDAALRTALDNASRKEL